MCRDRTRAHPARARATRGYFLRLLAAAERGPGRAKRGSPCRRSKAKRTRAQFRRPRGSGDPAPLLFRVPSKAAAKGGRTSRVPRTRAARGIAPIRLSGHGWPVSRTRPPVADRSRSERRGAEGAVFFGYFLLGKQKKVTGRQDGGRNTQGRESVIATKPQRRARLALTLPSPASGRGEKQMDPGFRRDDGAEGFRTDDATGRLRRNKTEGPTTTTSAARDTPRAPRAAT